MTKSVAIIGGGPAGLMAAEAAVEGGAKVDLYDAMPSVGRKLLLAGKGGLNLTHGEPLAQLLERYGTRRAQLEPLLRAFGPDALRAWAQGLGVDTFSGSSGRVFPADMKAAPLLRAWLNRLRAAGLRLHARHRWRGWSEEESGAGALRFATPRGERTARADATVLALGGGSWPQLGSDGAWTGLLERRGVAVAPLQPSNCGFDVGWTPYFRGRFAGEPVKTVVASFAGREGRKYRQPGEFIVTETGIEGGLVYALSAPLRECISATGGAVLQLDLVPDRGADRLVKELSHPQGRRSMASHMQSRSGLKGVKVGLLRELVPAQDFADPRRLVAAIKSLPLKLVAARPLAEAISTAGGVAFEALEANLMVRALPGVFCAGEMLDWEAPTGGYLLTACFATGRAAGLGALQWLTTDKQD
jgi:uncharacterized flavoprotein (TIGR03862 family)